MERQVRLVLNTPAHARQTAARIAKRIFAGQEEDLSAMRLLLDFIKVVMQGFKVESDMAVQKRLDELENRLSRVGR